MNNRILRAVVLIVFLFVLGFTGKTYYNREISRCMGIPVLSEDTFKSIPQFTQRDFSNVILLDGYPAAIDKSTSTI